MNVIKLIKTQHRNSEIIQILFPFDEKINLQIKSLPQRHYSKTLQSWYFKKEDFDPLLFHNQLKDLAIIDWSTYHAIPLQTSKKIKWDQKPKLKQEDYLLILKYTRNLKHKAILALLIGSNVPIHQVTDLTIDDITIPNEFRPFENKTQSNILHQYLKKYKPTHYLFESTSAKKYTHDAIKKILWQAITRAGIRKNYSSFYLR